VPRQWRSAGHEPKPLAPTLNPKLQPLNLSSFEGESEREREGERARERASERVSEGERAQERESEQESENARARASLGFRV